MRFKKALATSLCAVVAALGGAVAKGQGLDPGANTIVNEGVAQVGEDDYLVIGRIEAVNRKCAANRRVELQLRRDAGFRTVDSARTSARQAFALRSDLSAEARILAPAAKVDVGGRTIRCDRSSASLRPDR